MPTNNKSNILNNKVIVKINSSTDKKKKKRKRRYIVVQDKKGKQKMQEKPPMSNYQYPQPIIVSNPGGGYYHPPSNNTGNTHMDKTLALLLQKMYDQENNNKKKGDDNKKGSAPGAYRAVDDGNGLSRETDMLNKSHQFIGSLFQSPSLQSPSVWGGTSENTNNNNLIQVLSSNNEPVATTADNTNDDNDGFMIEAVNAKKLPEKYYCPYCDTFVVNKTQHFKTRTHKMNKMMKETTENQQPKEEEIKPIVIDGPPIIEEIKTTPPQEEQPPDKFIEKSKTKQDHWYCELCKTTFLSPTEHMNTKDHIKFKQQAEEDDRELEEAKNEDLPPPLESTNTQQEIETYVMNNNMVDQQNGTETQQQPQEEIINASSVDPTAPAEATRTPANDQTQTNNDTKYSFISKNKTNGKYLCELCKSWFVTRWDHIKTAKHQSLLQKKLIEQQQAEQEVEQVEQEPKVTTVLNESSNTFQTSKLVPSTEEPTDINKVFYELIRKDKKDAKARDEYLQQFGNPNPLINKNKVSTRSTAKKNPSVQNEVNENFKRSGVTTVETQDDEKQQEDATVTNLEVH